MNPLAMYVRMNVQCDYPARGEAHHGAQDSDTGQGKNHHQPTRGSQAEGETSRGEDGAGLTGSDRGGPPARPRARRGPVMGATWPRRKDRGTYLVTIHQDAERETKAVRSQQDAIDLVRQIHQQELA